MSLDVPRCDSCCCCNVKRVFEKVREPRRGTWSESESRRSQSSGALVVGNLGEEPEDSKGNVVGAVVFVRALMVKDETIETCLAGKMDEALGLLVVYLRARRNCGW